MTPQRPNYPYDCPLLLSKDDVKAFRDANVNLAEMAQMLKDMKEMTVDNHHTLRGNNGDDGMIARLSRLEEIVENMATIVIPLRDVPDKLNDMPKQIEQYQRYPSLTWLVHHKPKEMFVVTASVIALAVFIGFPGT